MDATTVAVDLAKDVFEVATANRAGRILERKRLTRRQFEVFVDALPAGTDGRDGSLRDGALLGPPLSGARASRAAVAGPVREALRATQQDGPDGHRSPARSRAVCRDSARAGENARAASVAGAPSGAHAVAADPDGADQRAARDAARTRDAHRAGGPDGADEDAADLGRRRQRTARAAVPGAGARLRRGPRPGTTASRTSIANWRGSPRPTPSPSASSRFRASASSPRRRSSAPSRTFTRFAAPGILRAGSD